LYGKVGFVKVRYRKGQGVPNTACTPSSRGERRGPRKTPCGAGVLGPWRSGARIAPLQLPPNMETPIPAFPQDGGRRKQKENAPNLGRLIMMGVDGALS